MEREKWGNGRGRGFFLCRKSRAKSGAKTSQPRCDWFHKDEKWESRNLSHTQLLLDLACRIPATFGPLFFLIPEYKSEVRMNVPVFTIRSFNSGLSELMAVRENLLFTATPPQSSIYVRLLRSARWTAAPQPLRHTRSRSATSTNR